MKKCASCSKDLPEAALHCVFCGAKQSIVPAVAPSPVAKTAFGYSANDVKKQVAATNPNALGTAATAYSPANRPSQPPPIRAQTPSQPPMPPRPPMRPSQPPPASPHAKTMMAQAAPPQPYNTGGGMGIHSPQQPTPAPLRVVPQPYFVQPGVGHAARPSEPWRTSLQFQMVVWGVLALAAFATPLSMDPMKFNWDLLSGGAAELKIPLLMWAGIGALGMVIGLSPMAVMPRGVLAIVLGFGGIVTPIALTGHAGEWRDVSRMIGALALVPGLLVRSEYVESTFARILVTAGVVATLVPYLVPDEGHIPLVAQFRGLLDAPGTAKLEYVMNLLQVVLVVLALLVWTPGPASAGANVWAWMILLYPLVEFAVRKLVAGGIGDAITHTPGAFVEWQPALTYSVMAGYGLATVTGKQLE